MNENKYRAVFYARVSTVHDSQAESITNQIELCKSYLKRHPEVGLVEPVDCYTEKISGKTDMREKFQMLLERLGQGDIDYLMVKDLKRLSRSTEVSAKLRNLSQEYGFKIILLATGQVYDPNASDTRMMYGFESLVNEELVFRQSEYGRVAHRQKCEAKRLNRNNVTFGYRWDKEKQDIVIDEEQAVVVRELFDRYVFLNEGVKELRNYLSSIGLHYSHNTVTKWLQERNYIGDYCFNRKGSELSVGSGKKTKRYDLPKEEWVHVSRPDLAIVDKDIFDLAQEIRASRIRIYAADVNGNLQSRFKGTHLFSSKIYCNECGYSFIHGYADRQETVHIYRDSFIRKNRNALEKCRNRNFSRVYEEDMKNIILLAINGIVQEREDIFPLLNEALGQAVRENMDYENQIIAKEKERSHLQEQAEKVQDAFIDANKEMREGLNTRLAKLNGQIMNLEEEIERLRSCEVDEREVEKRLSNIKTVVEKWRFIDSDMLNRKVVDAFIYKIVVHADGVMDVYLNTNEVRHYTVPSKANNKEGDSEKGPPFYVIGTNFRHWMGMYLIEAEKIVKEMLLEKCVEGIYIMIMTFTVEEKRSGTNEGDSGRILKVCVYIYISRKD